MAAIRVHSTRVKSWVGETCSQDIRPADPPAEAIAPNSTAADEFLRLELQQAIETFRQWHTLAIQVAAGLLAAEAALIGTALITRSPIPAAICVAVTGVTLGLVEWFQSRAAAAAFASFVLEKRAGVSDGFVMIYLRVTRSEAITAFERAVTMDSSTREFRHTVRNGYTRRQARSHLRRLVVVAGVLQTLLTIGLLLGYFPRIFPAT
jgi:hypothetical protein